MLKTILLIGFFVAHTIFGNNTQAAHKKPIAGQQQQQLYLLLIINQVSTGRIIPVQQKGELFYVQASDINNFIEKPIKKDDEQIELNAIEGLQFTYQAHTQRLLLSIPPAWLKTQMVEPNALSFTPAVSGTGALVNYNFYSYKNRNYSWQHSLWHEARLFTPHAVIRSTGLLRHQRQYPYNKKHTQYIRYDTSLEHNNQNTMQSYQFGDFITRTPAWANATRLGGLQISKNFGLRPDLITYPLPAFSGQVEVPTVVDVFLNETQYKSYDLEPGPFSITDIPNISGAGEANISFRDAQGRTVSETLPFYVSNRLLKPGLDSYNVAIGFMREQFGTRNFNYGRLASTLSYRRGLSTWLTLGGHTEATRNYQSAGFSGTIRIGQLGIVEAALQNSRYRGESAFAYDLSYHYQRKRFNLNMQYKKQGEQFRTLAQTGKSKTNWLTPKTKNLQITTGLTLGNWGSLGAGYFYRKIYHTPNPSFFANLNSRQSTRLWSVSYHKPLGKRTFLNLTANRHQRQGWTAMLQLSIVLPDNKGQLTLANRRSADKSHSQTIQYRNPPPLAGGWGWDLAYQRYSKTHDRSQIRTSQRNRYNTWSVGAYQEGSNYQYFGELQGALAVMDGQVFPTNEIQDTFAVISTDGISDVPVLYENQLIGKTNHDGYLLVPYGSAYYAGKYSINPLSLPPDISIPIIEDRIAIKSQSGYLIKFPLKKQQPFSFILVDTTHQPLAVGTKIKTQTDVETYVGWEGLVYIPDLQEKTKLTAYKDGKPNCQAELIPQNKTEATPSAEQIIICR